MCLTGHFKVLSSQQQKHRNLYREMTLRPLSQNLSRKNTDYDMRAMYEQRSESVSKTGVIHIYDISTRHMLVYHRLSF